MSAIVPRVSVKAFMASTVDDRFFLVPMSRLASNHTDTRAYLQRMNVAQDALCQCAWDMIQSAMGFGTVQVGYTAN
jgi:hypothetical protein